MKALTTMLCSVGFVMMFTVPSAAETRYEVWGVDQSNSPGKTYGGTLYIYDGKELERGHRAAQAVPEKIDLSTAAAARFHATTSHVGVFTKAGLSSSESSTRCNRGVTPSAAW